MSRCGCTFRWAVSESGKYMPVDSSPHPEGNIRLHTTGSGLPTAIVLAGQALTDARRDGEPLYLSHHVTCPAADEFRGRT